MGKIKINERNNVNKYIDHIIPICKRDKYRLLEEANTSRAEGKVSIVFVDVNFL